MPLIQAPGFCQMPISWQLISTEFNQLCKSAFLAAAAHGRRLTRFRIPPNVTTMQFNIEDDSWVPLLDNCDLVHMRLLLGSIRNELWEGTYRKAFK